MKAHFASNIFSISLVKLAKAVADISLRYRNQSFSEETLYLAFLDSMYSSEMIIRSTILKARVSNYDLSIFQDESNEFRQLEIFNHLLSIPFSELPRQLQETTGKSINNINAYYEMNSLRYQLFNQGVDPDLLTISTLRFAFESIEPLIINEWGQIILLHVPDLDFDIDRHIEELLDRFHITPSSHDELDDSL